MRLTESEEIAFYHHPCLPKSCFVVAVFFLIDIYNTGALCSSDLRVILFKKKQVFDYHN